MPNIIAYFDKNCKRRDIQSKYLQKEKPLGNADFKGFFECFPQGSEKIKM